MPSTVTNCTPARLPPGSIHIAYQNIPGIITQLSPPEKWLETEMPVHLLQPAASLCCPSRQQVRGAARAGGEPDSLPAMSQSVPPGVHPQEALQNELTGEEQEAQAACVDSQSRCQAK